MILSDFAISRRITIYLVTVIITVAGSFCYWVIPRESDPEIIIPIIFVETQYEGVSAADIESLITIPIERKLAGLSGVKRIYSFSREGSSVVRIEFLADTDLDTALQKVRDKVDQARPDLPEDASEPNVQEVNLSELPIMFVTLTGDVGMSVLTEFAEELEDVLEALPGVLDTRVIGGVKREIQIVVDPDRVSQYGISLLDLVSLARLENVNTPAGSMRLGSGRFPVRVPGEFRTPDDIRNLVVKATPKGVVYVRDIAEVYDSTKEVSSLSRLDGVPCVTLTVSKRSGSNVIAVSDAVHRAVEEFKTRLLGGMNITVTMDEASYVRDTVTELENNMLSGFVLVLLVIFTFLGLGNALIVASAIPLSMMLTFILLYLTGTTLNIVVLFSLILVLGMLVDNGIVVVENIYRHRQMGLGPFEAARKGAGEVALPVIGSTATTLVAFIPLFFWPGIMGSFMFYLPETVIAALSASLFVGLLVNPAFATLLRSGHSRPESAGVPAKRSFVIRLYAAALRFSLHHPWITLSSAFCALVIISVRFFATSEVEFLPKVEPYRSSILVDASEGTSLPVTDGLVRKIEGFAETHRAGLDYILANAGSRGASEFDTTSSEGVSHIGEVTLDFKKFGTAPILPSTILTDIRSKLTTLAGVRTRIEDAGMGPPPKPPVNVEIRGEDFSLLARIAEEIKDRIQSIPGLVDIDDDYTAGKPEFQVHIDRQQALLLGLNTRAIGAAVQAAIHGIKAGEYRAGDDSYDVVVRFPEAFRDDLKNLEAMTLVNLQGHAIPLATVAQVRYAAGHGTITRVDRKRTITVSADVKGRPGVEGLRDVQNRLADLRMPPGYSLRYTGEDEDRAEAQAFLQRAFGVAVALIALVLVLQFNSLLEPLVILSSVVLSLTGVFLGLHFHNMPFDIIMGGIGCISLAGVVVNNAIVLLDFARQKINEGIPLRDALIETGVVRFRPVMLTAVTTILGLIPMAAGITYDFRTGEWIIGGESSQWWGPLAISVAYGLGFATLLTLIVVPTLYFVLLRFRAAIGLGDLEAQRAQGVVIE